MFIKIKNTLQILVCTLLAIQLGGCIFVDRGRGHPGHHDNGRYHDHDSGFDIRVRG